MRGNKKFKKGGASWSRGGCLKKEGAGIPLLTMKILAENLSKHTNPFYKVNQENNNPSYTDVNSQNDQPYISPKKSIKINNTNTNCSTDVTRNNFLSQSCFSVLNCDDVLQ